MSNKSLSKAYEEYEEYEHERIIEERNGILNRKENFEREQLSRKIECMENLSNSILTLANSLVKSSSNNARIINIYIDKDISPEKLGIVLDKAGVS